MAVENKYVNSRVNTGKREISSLAGLGEKPTVIRTTFEVAAADSDGSVYRIARGIPTRCRIAKIEIANDAITGGTDWDLGFYLTDDTTGVGQVPVGGAVLIKDVLLNGGDLSAAHTHAAPLSGTSALDLPDFVKPIYELLGNAFQDEPASVDLALTANTVGSGAGTILVTVTLLPPVV
jgi:hypothetical protein